MSPSSEAEAHDAESPIEIGIATRAMPGDVDEPCGDIGFAMGGGGHEMAGLIDGLGHGVHAHDIARRARAAIETSPVDEPLDRIFELLGQMFRGDRGFVAALCRANAQSGQLDFCGTGNITTRLFNDREYTLISGAGIVGQYSARPKLRTLPFPAGSFLVLHTDGMSSHLHAEELLRHQHEPAAEAARALLDAYARPNDDCGVVVMRHRL